jgi:hypothetical protein
MTDLRPADRKKMQRVTLNGIQRRGLANWRARDKWLNRRVSIWSREHTAWWQPGGHGYTDKAEEAGTWDFADAYETTKHCGPEKKIVFYAVAAV